MWDKLITVVTVLGIGSIILALLIFGLSSTHSQKYVLMAVLVLCGIGWYLAMNRIREGLRRLRGSRP